MNTLIFPNLAAGNIAYKLIQEMGGFEVVGPVLLGLRKPFHILQMGSSVREIVKYDPHCSGGCPDQPMIHHLTGQIVELTPTHAVVECGGVGYFVHLSLHTSSAFAGQTEAKVLIHAVYREDAQLLFGFAEDTERRLVCHADQREVWAPRWRA